MRINLQTLVGRVTLRQVRDLLRRHDNVSGTNAGALLGMGTLEAAPFLQELASLGYIEKNDVITERLGVDHYQPTELGQRLRNAKAYKRISRSKAMAILERLHRAIEAINADEALVYHVDEIYVFGSMLNGGEDIGDVDIAFRLEPRPAYEGDLAEANLARARQSGKAHRNYLQELFYGNYEVVRLLKKPSRMIELHNIDDLEALGADAALFFSRQGGFVEDWHLRPLTRFGGCAGGGG